ncbi:hypothetical protein BDV12DRAFT_164428 [Aspergillus spectabilis]
MSDLEETVYGGAELGALGLHGEKWQCLENGPLTYLVHASVDIYVVLYVAIYALRALLFWHFATSDIESSVVCTLYL